MKYGAQAYKHATKLMVAIERAVDRLDEPPIAEFSRLEAREAFRMLSIYLNFELTDKEK